MARQGLGAVVQMDPSPSRKMDATDDLAPKPTRRPRRKKYRVNGVKLVLFIACCYVVVSLVGQQLQVMQLETELAQLGAELQETQATNLELKQDIIRLQDDESYLGYVARQKLGMVKDGEIQYIFQAR